MKYTKMIIALLLAVTLTACTNAAETEETSLSESVTSEAADTEESVLTTESETETETTTIAETTTETTAETTAESVTETTSETTAQTTTEAVTETAPPIPQEVLDAEKRLNMEVICNLYESYAVKYDGDFTVDLKSITPDTDLHALSNAVEHEIGNEFEIDLDGDGKNEKISSRFDIGYEIYDRETHTSEFVSDKPSDDVYYDEIKYLNMAINDNVMLFDVNNDYFQYNDDWDRLMEQSFFTCDIDSSDNYIEIAFTNPRGTNDFSTTFFRYENGELHKLFELGDTFDCESERHCFDEKMNYVIGQPIITDGSGVITASMRDDSLQTWLFYVHYLYDSDSGQIYYVSEPTYPYYYENLNNFEYARNAISDLTDAVPYLNVEKELYSEPDLTSEKTTISPQNIQVTAEYPYAKSDDKILLWAHIVAEDGSCGWIHFDETENVDDTLSGMVRYD